jgi:exosome complex exonuclease RRP6
MEDTPLVLVENRAQLEALIHELNAAGEFAFDLEHHSMRSFLGLSCLLQISTRRADYIVDPFPLWEHMHLLNEPFTNPSIVKVDCGGFLENHGSLNVIPSSFLNFKNTFRENTKTLFTKIQKHI